MKRILLMLAAVLALSGCSVQKMAAEAVLDYTKTEAVPFLMAQSDLTSACTMGQGLGPVVSSLSRIELKTEEVGIGTMMAAGMCAEMVQREAELEKMRALYENRTAAAQDALIREKLGHNLAAARMYTAYENALATYGDLSEGCRKYETETEELLSLLGVASGALALLHDFNSEKVVGIPLDVPVKIEKAAQCFDDKKWWGMPTALRASIWLSIPGSGPEGVDPLTAMEEAAREGDKQGVALARAMLAMMATNVGNEEVKCRALAEASADGMKNEQYALLNAYAFQMMTHQSDMVWTRAQGYRAPYMTLGCPSAAQPSSVSDDDLDDILGDMGFDDESSESEAGGLE